jgi:hypothetical protein
MKYLKTFNEAVIHPPKLENDFIINSFDDLVEYGNQNNFDVVNYDNFYNSLSNDDKKTAPPRQGVPFFALFHPQKNKAMFVLSDEKAMKRFPNFKEIVDDIIGHELVHQEQTRRRGGIEFNLPNPIEQNKYFSNKEEIMAFSWTIANDLSKKSQTVEDAIHRLDSGGGFDRSQWKQIWGTINRVCDGNVIKRYRKYIYLYLTDMLSKEKEENIHTKISNK